MPSALTGLTVVDLSSFVPGPYASMLLADMGAEVIHVEPPTGEPSRAVRPRRGADSALHAWLGRGKSSVFLDLKSDAGRDRLIGLVRRADVVIEGFAPGVAARLGVDYESCRSVSPAIIYCSISASGQADPSASLPGHDLDALARAGVLDQLRDGAGDVISAGPLFGDVSAGLHAAVGILAALRYREQSGLGQWVDVSILGGALAMAGSQLVKSLAGSAPEPGIDLNLGGDPAYRAYRARDGRWFVLAGLEEKFWQEVCRLLEREDLIDRRRTDPAAVIAELQRIFATEDRSVWDGLLDEARVCYAPVNSLDEVPTDPRVVGAALISEGRLNNPIRLSLTPPVSSRPAPNQQLEEK